MCVWACVRHHIWSCVYARLTNSGTHAIKTHTHRSWKDTITQNYVFIMLLIQKWLKSILVFLIHHLDFICYENIPWRMRVVTEFSLLLRMCHNGWFKIFLCWLENVISCKSTSRCSLEFVHWLVRYFANRHIGLSQKVGVKVSNKDLMWSVSVQDVLKVTLSF